MFKRSRHLGFDVFIDIWSMLMNIICSDNSESSLSRYDNMPGTLATKSAIVRGKGANIGANNGASAHNGANIGATSGISSDSGKRENTPKTNGQHG
jgi:hypothetical protein